MTSSLRATRTQCGNARRGDCARVAGVVMRPWLRPIFCLGSMLSLLAVANLVAFGQNSSIVHSPHNLSASGPGSIRATAEEQVCIFCHTAHNASDIRPLWNRFDPSSVYTVYASDSLVAEPGQPTGASKMCLSCHDGTIAIGSVISRDQPIHLVGGVTTMPSSARGYIGTDLSDDHPISFRYDSTLATRNPKLLDPRSLPAAMRLDHNQELQCTTCHDPHNNMHGSFLVMSNENSAMCRSCHVGSTTTVPGHTDCASCHQTHSAPSGPHLLRGQDVAATCLSCHNGSVGSAQNIATDMNKPSSHDSATSPLRIPSAEDRRVRTVQNSPFKSQNFRNGHAFVTCTDCHDPHSMNPGGFASRFSGASTAPYIQASLGSVSGVNASGGSLDAARMEYEVCYKCHADTNVISSPRIPRQIAQNNMRLMFGEAGGGAAASAHPVHVPGTAAGNSPSLRIEWRDGRAVYCSDCHGSDTSRKAGGSGPDGVHGSIHAGMLLARYETADFTIESPSAYALCYTCHDRDGPEGILSDRSFRYHRLHVVENRTPCSACHDSHGISSAQGSRIHNAALMNFDLSIVSPDPRTGRLEYRSSGAFSGSCYLSCHGAVHSPKEY
jgi:predicted CXXCH cytochrome family protein